MTELLLTLLPVGPGDRPPEERRAYASRCAVCMAEWVLEVCGEGLAESLGFVPLLESGGVEQNCPRSR